MTVVMRSGGQESALSYVVRNSKREGSSYRVFFMEGPSQIREFLLWNQELLTWKLHLQTTGIIGIQKHTRKSVSSLFIILGEGPSQIREFLHWAIGIKTFF